MKKILLAVAILGSAFMANAQNEFAPKKGSMSTEIQFAPFGNNIFTTNAITGDKDAMQGINGGVLSGTYFFTNKDAITLDLGLAGYNNKGEIENEAYAGYENPFTKEYKGIFGISVGYQRHFYNYKRIDLYYGAKLGYYHVFAGHKDQGDDNNYTWTNLGTGNGFNAYLTTGINFFIYKGLFIGAEIDCGISDTVYCSTTTKTLVKGDLNETKQDKIGHSLEGGFQVKPLIRLGWAF